MNITITISYYVKVEVQHKVQEDKMDREELMGQELGPGEFSDDGNDFLLYSLHFQGGYIYLEYGKNVCGMAKSPLYAEV